MTLDQALDGLDDKLRHAIETESGPRDALRYFHQDVLPLLKLPCDPEPNPAPIHSALVTLSQQIGILGVTAPVPGDFRRHLHLGFGVFQIAGKVGEYVCSDRVRMGAIGLPLSQNSTQCRLFVLPANPMFTNDSHIAAVKDLADLLRKGLGESGRG
jgi:hypothetical protein